MSHKEQAEQGAIYAARIMQLEARLAEWENGTNELWRKYADVIDANAELGTLNVTLSARLAEAERQRDAMTEIATSGEPLPMRLRRVSALRTADSAEGAT